nr:AzlC family ABC transporter permease [Actinomadura macra]
MRDGLGVGLAVGVSGLAFGAAAVTAGLSVAQACVLSLLAFTGASQFALIGVIGGGGGLVAGTLGAVLLGGRNALYGLRLARTLDVRGWRRALTAQTVIDETTAVATAQEGRAAARAGFYTTAITLYVMWNMTSLLGAAGAARLGDPKSVGLDVLGPAVFLALLWPRLTGDRGGAPAERRAPVRRLLRKPGASRTPAVRLTAVRVEVRVAVGAAVIAVAATPLLPPGVPVMLAAVAALPALVAREGAR